MKLLSIVICHVDLNPQHRTNSTCCLITEWIIRHAFGHIWIIFRSQPKLNYFWDKVEVDRFGKVTNVLPLPNQARLTDHNRVVQIPDVQLYDGGVYRCRVDRTNGGATSKTVQVMLQGTAATALIILHLVLKNNLKFTREISWNSFIELLKMAEISSSSSADEISRN